MAAPKHFDPEVWNTGCGERINHRQRRVMALDQSRPFKIPTAGIRRGRSGRCWGGLVAPELVRWLPGLSEPFNAQVCKMPQPFRLPPGQRLLFLTLRHRAEVAGNKKAVEELWLLHRLFPGFNPL